MPEEASFPKAFDGFWKNSGFADAMMSSDVKRIAWKAYEAGGALIKSRALGRASVIIITDKTPGTVKAEFIETIRNISLEIGSREKP